MGWFVIYFRQCRIIYAGKDLDSRTRGISVTISVSMGMLLPGAGMCWPIAILSTSLGRVEFALPKGRDTAVSLDKELIKDDNYVLDYCGHETRGSR